MSSPEDKIAAALLLLGLLAAGHALAHPSYFMRRVHSNVPPFEWRLDVSSQSLPVDPNDIRLLARALRARALDERRFLDVNATIKNAVASADLASLQFRFGTYIPEYVGLVDQQSSSDQFATALLRLMKQLAAEGVQVKVFTFRGDPRTWFGAEGLAHPVALMQHHGNRLILVGNAASLCDDLSGNVRDWAHGFWTWDKSIFLSTDAPIPDPLRAFLADHDAVAVAPSLNTSELVIAADAISNIGGTERFRATRHYSELPLDLTITGLRDYLGPLGFRWLCTCAIFHRLDFDLTLRLRELLEIEPKEGAWRTLIKIVQLPWFRKGEIPDEIRQQLVRSLSVEDRLMVRREITEILRRSRPERGSFAANDHALTLLAYERALIKKNDKEGEGEAEIRLTGGTHDLLDIYVPRRIREALKKSGSWPALVGRYLAESIIALWLGLWGFLTGQSFMGPEMESQETHCFHNLSSFEEENIPFILAVGVMASLFWITWVFSH